MSNTLKACPFCGGKAVEYLHRNGKYYIANIVCKECGASTKYFAGSDRYVVRASRYAWNRRVKTDAKCVSCEGGYCEEECEV